MTCIVGFTDKKTGITYLGGDSLASNSYKKQILDMKKVFKLKDTTNSLIVGYSGNLRGINLLQYSSEFIDKRDEPNINTEYIVTKFIPKLIKVMENAGASEYNSGIKESPNYFLLAYQDKLWQIDFNYGVIEWSDNYCSIGCGFSYALGSLKTTENMDLKSEEKIHLALQSASKFDSGVAPPFYIINTKNDDIIEFKE